ncbi:MAG: hypothetical protein WC428_01640 [Candidatus Paceibacterota bacterium]
MNINELFDKIQEGGLSENLSGELIVKGNCMIWTYDLNKNTEEIEAPTDEDGEEPEFSFESSSPEELLLEAYTEDLETIESFLDELNEDCWTISEPEISETVISFKIF